MPAERRSEEAILQELAAEREQLVDAIADVRASIEAKRRPAARAAKAAAVALGALVVLGVGRRLIR